MIAIYQDKLKDARFIDATEGQNTLLNSGSADIIEANTFLNSRF
jgi:hypothetical protein